MKKALLACGIAMLLGSTAARADFIDQFQITGTVTSDNQDYTVSASALVTFNDAANTLTITLDNLSNMQALIQVLTNFEFDSQAGITYGAVTVGDPTNTVTCTGNGSNTDCTAGPTYPGGFDGWGVVDSGTTVELGAGLTQGGTFALHPWGIVNGSILTNCPVGADPGGAGSCDGLGTTEIQPYLLSPVTFTIGVTGTMTDIQNMRFTWGTEGAVATSTSTSSGPISTSSGPISEPNSSALTLLGVLMIGAAFMVRGRSRHA